MKTKITILLIIILLIIGLLLTSCGAETAAQETEVVTEATVEIPINELSMTQEPVFTKEPIATAMPTEAPTKTPLACVTLLTPENGADLPVTGKVTFSWSPMDEAGSYVLTFVLPSGSTASFETNQTFRDRYMEAFSSGGEYQWQVTAQNIDGSEICVSEVSTFNKVTYEKPRGNNNDTENKSGQPPTIETPGTGE